MDTASLTIASLLTLGNLAFVVIQIGDRLWKKGKRDVPLPVVQAAECKFEHTQIATQLSALVEATRQLAASQAHMSEAIAVLARTTDLRHEELMRRLNQLEK